MNEIQTQHNVTIKTFQSDNALENTFASFKQYFVAHGILHETSCAYTPQQNGGREKT